MGFGARIYRGLHLNLAYGYTINSVCDITAYRMGSIPIDILGACTKELDDDPKYPLWIYGEMIPGKGKRSYYFRI